MKKAKLSREGAIVCSAVGIVCALLICGVEVTSAQTQIYPQVIGQVPSYGGHGVIVAPPVAAPFPLGVGERNSAGWNTGYSAITATSERPNPLGHALGGSRTVTETTTRVVPNDALGQPIRGAVYGSGERNSAGWNTGYSVVTDTYERPDPLGRALGGSPTVKETTTRVVPNNAFGEPIEPILPFWP